MSFASIRAAMLNNRAKKGSKEVLSNLRIRQGDVIADIGAGGGYFAFKMAKQTGLNGKVFAVDTNKSSIEYLKKSIAKENVQNIKTIFATETENNLPKESSDLIFMRNVFHHIKDPVSYFLKLKESLKPNGRIAIIDWDDTAGGYVGKAGHFTPEKDILKAMKQADFIHLESFDFLPQQSFNIFKVK